MSVFGTSSNQQVTPSNGGGVFGNAPVTYQPPTPQLKPVTTVSVNPNVQPSNQGIFGSIGGAISNVGNFIDNLFKAPQVHSPVPNQNTAPVNKAPVDIAKQAVTETFPQSSTTASSLLKDPLNFKGDLGKGLQDAWEAIKQPAIEQIKQNLNDAYNHPTSFSAQLGNEFSKISKTANVIFSPLSALFALGNQLPVVGSATKLLTLPFTAIGEVVPQGTNKIVDELPISKQAKEQIKPGLAEIATLAAQLVFGHVSEGAIEPIKAKLAARFGPEDAKTIVDKATEIAKDTRSKNNQFTPAEIQNEVLTSDLKNTKAGQELLKSSFEAEKQGKHIQVAEGTEDPNALKTPGGTAFSHTLIEPGTKSEATNFTPLKTGVESKPDINVKPQEVAVPREQLPVGTGEEKVTALESRMSKALKDAPDEVKHNLSTFNEMTNKDQIHKAADYVMKNPEEALKVLKGDVEAPKGILHNAIYVAMDQMAKNDVTLATKLAGLRSTRFGQEIEILKELDPDSAVRRMDEIVKVREDNIVKRSGGKTVKQATTDITKQIKARVKAPDKFDWNHFISSLEC